MKFIHTYKSPNFNIRKKKDKINYIIIHYTALKDDLEALKHLTDKKNKVSSHFFISKKGRIYNLVSIDKRAWHAGISFWKGLKDLNSESIGIELDNNGSENFKIQQVDSLITLIRYLSKKYSINQNNILGHSDISPYRKIDPGKKFPWIQIQKRRLVFLPKKIDEKKFIELEKKLKFKKNSNKQILYLLSKIGYDVRKAKKHNKYFSILIKAYQIHYRPKLISGRLDRHTKNLIFSHYCNEILT